MIKTFPHILCRVGGMPFSELEVIGFSDEFLELNEKLIFIQDEFEKYKNIVIEHLKHFKPIDDNFSTIRKIKKVVYKNRIVSIELIEIESLNGQLERYNQLLSQYLKSKNKFQIEFEKEYQQQRLTIQNLAKQPNFQKALPLSSISFAKQLQRYLDKNPVDFKKKELQTERAVMQYLARMAAKTSPFSSFTTVNYGTVRPDRFLKYVRSSRTNQKNTSTCRYNNQVLELLQTLFLSKIDFLSKLNIRLNPTLEKQNSNYRFLINHQNIESFQTIEQQDFLTVIETYFEEKSTFLVNDLIFSIINDYEIETEMVIDFLMELVAIGFFEVDFGYNSTTENWLVILRDYIANVPCTSRIDIEFVEILIRNLKDFENTDLTLRITILEDSHQLINEFIHRHFNKNIQLELSPEQLIYEDVASDFELNFDKKAVDKLVNSLHDLLQQVHFIQGKERLQMTFFFKNNYDENEEIPLLDFYEQYYKIGKKIEEKNISTIQAEAKLLKSWAKAVSELVKEKYVNGQSLQLEIADLQSINEKLEIKLIPLNNISLSCFAQVFEEGNELKALVNAVSDGYGKMVGRFLKLMPEVFIDDLRSANLQLQNTKNKLVENVDASFFNANLHPPFLDLEITIPNGQNQLSEKQQVKINDLKVCYKNEALILKQSSKNVEIQVLDLGIQVQKGRSPLYQLLSNFSPIVPDIQYLREAIENGIPQEKVGFEQYPQVNIDNLVLLRERSVFPDLGFLDKKGNLSSIEKWQKMKYWCIQQNISSSFFMKKKIKIEDKKSHSIKSKKPRCFDINNLILLDMFFRVKESKNNIYELIPTFPKVEKLFKIGNKKYFLECVLQWYKHQ